MADQDTTATQWQFFVTSVVAKNFPTPYLPLIYVVQPTLKITGYGIPTNTPQAISPMQINKVDPVLRVAKADGTFTLAATFNSGTYYMWAFWDQQPQAQLPTALWTGTNSKQNFALMLDLSHPGLVGAFLLNPV